MGNQLVGVAPSQIYPVEHYLSDHVDLTFDQSLGSTRFLKVARARSREGLVVVKVFAVHDPSLPLAEHKERILKIKEQLVSAFNCLPFQRVILTDKAGLLMREYCKCSVYDRMSTRPFLTTLEKKWITFQVLYALHRMHKIGICHGDIKLENIMVTSWLWVLLTDIASFKPTFLPDDNPADFSYFFDTSRRRLCYVAPERFVRAPDPHSKSDSDDKSGGLLLSESPCKVGELVPSMDIFSAGCALLELWNDGTPALDLPGLLAYRNGEDRPPTMTLGEGCEPALRDLLHSMTERNPKDRRSAELYLDEARGKLFPEYFYSFLQSYMLIFSAQPILPPDEKILRIHQDIRNIIKIFTQPSDAKNYKDLVEETTEHTNVDNIDNLKDGFKVLSVNVNDYDDEPDDKSPDGQDLGPDSEGLILITSLVTSCIRGLHHCTSKLYCLEILQLLCENSSSETILDRILPYIIHLSQSSVARVRAAGVCAGARALRAVRRVPPGDCNVFPEYVLPELAPRATDPAVPVRIAYANNIAKLAETAVRFLDQTQNMIDKEAANINYETELSALHEMVRSTVSYLLTDSQAVVKRALVENGITKLCIFFGKQKAANDVILSHMVTFLNDKEEVALRGCFFEKVVGVASYVGQHAAPILVPLLQQGLTDPSEWIIAKALRATTSLAELGLLPKQSLCDLVAESAVCLAHPNLWIRHEVCGLVSCVASLLNPIDVNCKILPLVWPHLKHKLIQVERAELLLESLADPIPRKVLDAVLRHGDVDRLVQTLRERRNTRSRVNQLVTLPAHRNLFASCSHDGTVRLWDAAKLQGHAHINRSKTMYNRSAGPVLSLVSCENGQSLVAATQEGSIFVLRSRVNQLVTLPAHRNLFASCSHDGTVRLWDAAKLQGHAHINRSKTMYNRSAGPVLSLVSCENGQSLVAATQEGSIFVLRVDSGSSRMTLSQCRQLETSVEGEWCALACAGGVHAGVISYGTLRAAVVGWDLRAPGNAWKLQGDLKQGVYTCLYANSCGYLAVGTSSGAVCVWDLRFQLPITTVRHPNSERVRRLAARGGAGSGLWAAAGRDAGAWCLEAAQRTHALGTREGSRFLITGGSDQRIRYWDLEHPEDSYIVVHAPADHLRHTPNAVKYRSRIIDGTTVIQEYSKVNPSTPTIIEDNVYRSVESRSFYHTAPITDLTLVEGVKPYLVSSAADGVINVWK
ncbi:hypothetical protein O3G_MSEX005972 [Manduca sexta]|uniref:non-specific serine/threonine protein kinase n=1 Tax=Manduca sexta TaxID=7130 RepID=A0A921Z1Z7_MANSE|nr:hypothetical protein O3G_MSEX005972 [Manduca sexta]